MAAKQNHSKPKPKPDFADFLRSKKKGLTPDKPTLSAARRKAIANMHKPSSTANTGGRTKGKLPEDTGQALDPQVDSPLGVRGSSSSKKNPQLRVN